jgi:hypothetical protein
VTEQLPQPLAQPGDDFLALKNFQPRNPRYASAVPTMISAMTFCIFFNRLRVGGAQPMSQVPMWYVTSAPTYANTVMYTNVKVGHHQLFVSRLIITKVAAH